MAAVARESGVGRVGQHVPDGSLRDELPEHHPEPSAAAALVERAGARVVGPACRYHPAQCSWRAFCN
jgi:hypothetical protein